MNEIRNADDVIRATDNTQDSNVSAALLANYESDTALSDTYVDCQVGAGVASGSTDTRRCNFDATINQETTSINSQNSYLRIDGPRCWIEMVVQAAVAYKSNGFVLPRRTHQSCPQPRAPRPAARTISCTASTR